jgi:hypothetical protein
MLETCRGNTAFGLLMGAVFLAGCTSEQVTIPEPVSDSKPKPLVIDARILDVGSEGPNHAALGKLRFRGGLILASDNSHFGGLSSISIAEDGVDITSISDRGDRIDATLIYDVHGNLAGIEGGTLQRLRGLDGNSLTKKRDSDAEAVASGADGGFVIAFERRHRLMKYSKGERTIPHPISMPDALQKAPNNGGIEALTRLKDGRLLAIAEKLEGEKAGDIIGWIGNETNWRKIYYVSDFGFSPTGAATLPDGDVVVLERGLTLWSGLTGRLKRIPLSALNAGVRIQGQLLAEVILSQHITNFEGIDARLGAKGETLIYMISDNNFSEIQKTVLIMLELVGNAVQE